MHHGADQKNQGKRDKRGASVSLLLSTKKREDGRQPLSCSARKQKRKEGTEEKDKGGPLLFTGKEGKKGIVPL